MTSRGRTARVLQSLAAALMLVGSIRARADAQWRSPVAVGAAATMLGESRQINRQAVAVPNEDTWRARDLWKWVGIGFFGGGVASEGWLALDIARNHSDDGMILPIVPIVLIGAAGGAGGGLVGAIAYTAAHPSPEPPPR